MSTGILLIILASLTAYLVLGGADFGGGIWDLLAHGKTAARQRELISRSIGPVWEANHVWLILALVATFSAFPPVYESIGRGLALPVSIALIGIVLRGAAYVYRSYGNGAAGPDHLWGRVFAVASAITPYMLGVTAAGLATGKLDDGAGLLTDPFAALTGGLTVVATAFLAAVYLCHDAAATDPELVPVFRRRAAGGAVIAGALALALLPTLPTTTGLHLGRAAGFIALSGTAGVVTLLLLWRRDFRKARGSAALAVAAILWGWAAAQYPALIVGRLTVSNAASTQTATFGVLLAGLVLLLPALIVLFKVFSQSGPASVSAAVEGPARHKAR
jgi:cytochrome d ubiquinol oxidase subunit II